MTHIDFIYESWRRQMAVGAGKLIDHLTHNVYGRTNGALGWVTNVSSASAKSAFRYQGEYTSLTSKAMTAPDGKIRIPLNEEVPAAAVRSRNICVRYNGEGSHIALSSEDTSMFRGIS
jgi:4-hydroxyphenylpyruvate dioxygenase